MGLAIRTLWWMKCDADCCTAQAWERESHDEAVACAKRWGWQQNSESRLWYCPNHRALAICPSKDCPMCTGEACSLCGAGITPDPLRPRCEHDVLERHQEGP